MMLYAQPEAATHAHVMFGGDAMLGRTVKEYIALYGFAYPLGPISNLMRQADLTVVNLECAITSSGKMWTGAPKAFYFGAPPEAVQSLSKAGIDLVSLANNHALDYDVEGLMQTLQHLKARDIRYAGAGRNISEARSPVIIERKNIRFGMAAFCDHQADFSAQQDTAGIAYLDLENETAALEAWRSALAPLQQESVHWPILSLHWGPNMVWRPSEKFRRLAHAAIDMGWKILFGHSAHVFHGIEMYRGCPIMYAAGDLVDDYYIDPEFNNDHQVLIEIELTSAEVKRIHLHPVLIQNCQARTASYKSFEYIAERMKLACAEMGSPVHWQGKAIWINGMPG